METAVLCIFIYLLIGAAITVKYWDVISFQAHHGFMDWLQQHGEKSSLTDSQEKIAIAVWSPVVWPLFVFEVFQHWWDGWR